MDNSVASEATAPTRFESSQGQLRLALYCRAINVAQAAFDSLSDLQRKSNETVPSAVGHVYGFVDFPETDNGRDRAKRLFVVDPRAGANLVKDRRRDFGALSTEWNKRFCAPSECVLIQRLHVLGGAATDEPTLKRELCRFSGNQVFELVGVMFEAIRAQGYSGSYTRVGEFAQRWREQQAQASSTQSVRVAGLRAR